MSLFGFSLRPRRAKTAQTAKDRLQILLAHERHDGSDGPDYLPMLQADILAVIGKYMQIKEDDVDIQMERNDEISSLEINIEIPSAKQEKPVASGLRGRRAR
ncbi:cell division topological specificity factor MinE [Citreicella sp. C3M06]|uniref:cell division topological specificity factor MinE n=1 Tax=Roseobacteraceae TaxID=2854170 RepID=UPI001C09B907|nr:MULTISPECIES: cell division topological specificity factor MinE [Roseobacteraceae]MBU2962009.1 cell division topological specificity factor MinE [Citreicella sp. C3M06]MDO6586131.1 cell division topological specificity factor MinE [Salipiger sp. 1_MG-2023]